MLVLFEREQQFVGCTHCCQRNFHNKKKVFGGVEGDGSQLYLEKNDLCPILAQKSSVLLTVNVHHNH